MIQIENPFAPSIDQPGLQIAVAVGSVLVSGSSQLVPAQSAPLPANSTSYVYLNTQTAAIQSNTSGFPSSNCYPIATVITSTNQVTSLTDSRPDVGGTGSGAGAVTSIFGRTGAVTAEANDYSSVSGLTLGDGSGNTIEFVGGTGVALIGQFGADLSLTSEAILTGPVGSALILDSPQYYFSLDNNPGNAYVRNPLNTSALDINCGPLNMTDIGGSVWNSATGGSQGAGTINAKGFYVNGVVVEGLSPSGNPITLSAGITSLNLFGDSIAYGQGLVIPSGQSFSPQVFGNLVAQALGITMVNDFGVIGATMQTFVSEAFSNPPSNSAVSMAIPGANEVLSIQGTPSFITQYIAGVTAFVTWLGLQSSQIVTAASMTFTGTWSLLGYIGSKYSNNASNTATATVNGTTVYVTMVYGTSGDFTSGYTITIDGTPVYSVTGQNSAIDHYPIGLRFSGLAAGNHTVVVTPQSGQFAVVAWIAGNGGASGSLPMVWLGNTLPSSLDTGGTVTSMNSDLATLVTNLQADGFNLVLTNTNAALNHSAQPPQYADNYLHPNPLGNALIAQAFLGSVWNSNSTAGLSAQDIAAIRLFLLNNGSVSQLLRLAPGVGGNIAGGGFVSTDLANIYVSTGLNTWGSFPILTYGNTVAQEVASTAVNKTAQSAAISATSLIASLPATGMYRVSWSAAITTASDGSSTLGGSNGFQLVFTSPTDSISKTTAASQTSSANTTGTAISGVTTVYAKTGTALQYQFGYTNSDTSTAMQYELHIANVEQM